MKHYSINTPIGKVRLEWEQDDVLTCIYLPAKKTTGDRCGGRVPAWLKPFADDLKAYFSSGSTTFDLAVLDLTQFTSFQQKVYRIVTNIPAGETM